MLSTDLTGSADGSVRLYEWGHIQPLAMLRQPGAFPKVTKVLFSAQGNKVTIHLFCNLYRTTCFSVICTSKSWYCCLQCCVSDTEGDVCLWQVGLGSNFTKPIMVCTKYHNVYHSVKPIMVCFKITVYIIAINPS